MTRLRESNPNHGNKNVLYQKHQPFRSYFASTCLDCISSLGGGRWAHAASTQFDHEGLRGLLLDLLCHALLTGFNFRRIAQQAKICTLKLFGCIHRSKRRQSWRRLSLTYHSQLRFGCVHATLKRTTSRRNACSEKARIYCSKYVVR